MAREGRAGTSPEDTPVTLKNYCNLPTPEKDSQNKWNRCKVRAYRADKKYMDNENKTRHTDGKYSYKNMDVGCKCGHTVGNHDAEKVRVDGVAYQYCQADGCDCECFKKARKSTKK